MAKRIVFCADGTWNGPEEETRVNALDGDDAHGEPDAAITNVVKLFANLAGNPTPETLTLHNEQERRLVDATGRTAQVAKYMHGVGDSSNAVKRVLGGVFGLGVMARIVRGYTFISRHYEPGDDIHIVGFSRGAYTARALGGLISCVGLLNRAAYDENDKKEAYRLGLAAWCKSKSIALHGAGKLTDMANSVIDFMAGMFARQLPKDGLIDNVPIKSIAVWDTVGSLGIPVYAANGRFDVFRFTDTALSPKVQRGFHAMAIDELRADFPVTRWNDRIGIRQVWFAGAHSDVGGGYAANECGLSDLALDWMIRQLRGVNVLFSTPLMHIPDTLQSGASVHEPWSKFPFSKLLRDARDVGAEDVIHDSVFGRWTAEARYRPAALKAFATSGLDGLHRDT